LQEREEVKKIEGEQRRRERNKRGGEGKSATEKGHRKENRGIDERTGNEDRQVDERRRVGGRNVGEQNERVGGGHGGS
jgi:hypothetical protein